MSGQHTMGDFAEIEARLRRDLAEIADRIGPPIGDGAEQRSRQVQVTTNEPGPTHRFGRPVVAAAAAVILVLTGGMLLFARDGDPDRINTVPPTSGLTATTTPVVTPSTVREVTTTTVASSPDDPAENAQLTPRPALLAPPLAAPVVGETQRSIVGEITWTSVQGDITTLPSDISFEHEGVFYADRDSYNGPSIQEVLPGPELWTSTDGVTWTPWADAPPDTGIDPVGSTLWASDRRWDGTEFVAVEFPPAGEVPGEGLTVGFSELSAVVEFDGRIVVKRSENFSVPWADVLGIEPPFEAREEGRPWERTFRVRTLECSELVGGRQCGSGGNEPATWVIRPEIVQGAPTRIDFYDNDTDELMTSVVPPDDGRPIDDILFEIGCCNHVGRRSTWFIADSDGTNARLIDGPLQDRPFTYARFAELGNRLFVLISDDSGGAVQLWVTDDFDAWEPVAPPTTIEQFSVSSTLISDGSTMIFSPVGPLDREGRPVTHRPFWTTTDGANWTAWESPLVGYPSRGPDAADFGWMDFHDYLGVPGASVYKSPALAISPDGEIWQTMPIPVPAALSELGIGWGDAPTEDEAGGWGWEAYAHGDTIFVVLRTDLGAREIWVGLVDTS